MPNITVNFSVDATRLEDALRAVLVATGAGRSCDELERLYEFLRGWMSSPDAALAFDNQLSSLERARVKSRVRLNRFVDSTAASIMFRAMAMTPLDTGALRASINANHP